MRPDEWRYADHALHFGLVVNGDGLVVPLSCDGGRIVAAGGGFVWCDVRNVSQYAADEYVIDPPFEACGVDLRGNESRLAWADDVAALDIEEPIWAISKPDAPRPRRMESPDDSSYWIGVGACRLCVGGMVAACVNETDGLLFVCQSCGSAWEHRADVGMESSVTRSVGKHDVVFATADQVAEHGWSRWQELLASDPRDVDAIELHKAERWTIRPQSVLSRRPSGIDG